MLDLAVHAWGRWVAASFASCMDSHTATQATTKLTLAMEEDMVEQEIPDAAVELGGSEVGLLSRCLDLSPSRA